MGVVEQRTELWRSLARDLGGGAIVVAAPDHPLLIEAPDILVGNEGGLLAVYLPKVSELRQPQRLQIRFVLSRLALPSETRHVLMIDDDTDGGQFASLQQDFSAHLSLREQTDISRIAKDRNFTGGRAPLPADITAYVRWRFSNALQTTQILRRLNREHEDQERSISAGVGVKRRRTRKFTHVGEDILFREIEGRSWGGSAIQSLATQTTRAAFSLDNGVPYPTHDDDYGLAIVDQQKAFRGDPEKYARAAAFAGWGLIPAGQGFRLQDVVKRFQDRRARREMT